MILEQDHHMVDNHLIDEILMLVDRHRVVRTNHEHVYKYLDLIDIILIKTNNWNKLFLLNLTNHQILLVQLDDLGEVVHVLYYIHLSFLDQSHEIVVDQWYQLLNDHLEYKQDHECIIMYHNQQMN